MQNDIETEKLCENDSLNNNSPLPEQMILKYVIRLVYIPEGNNPLFIISPISDWFGLVGCFLNVLVNY